MSVYIIVFTAYGKGCLDIVSISAEWIVGRIFNDIKLLPAVPMATVGESVSCDDLSYLHTLKAKQAKLSLRKVHDFYAR